MLRLRFVCLLVILPCVLSAQKLDSTRTVLADALSRNDRASIAYWRHALAYEYSQLHENDSALKYYYHSASTPGVESKLLAETYNAIGVLYSVKDYMDSAVHYYSEALTLYKSLGDTTAFAHLAPNLAILYKDQGDYQKALDVAFEAIKHLETSGASRELASCYTTVATVYSRLDEFDRALAFHKQALATRKSLAVPRSIAQSFNNIGETFMELKRYDSAHFYLDQSLTIKRQLGDAKSLAVTLNSIGRVYMNLRRNAESETFFLEALQLRQKQDDRAGLAGTLIDLASLYCRQQEFSTASLYVTEAEKLVRAIGSLSLLSDVLALKIILQKNKNDFKSALHTSEERMMVRDSLLAVEKVEALISVQARYESEKKEQEIFVLTAKEKVSQAALDARGWWIITLIVAILLVAIIAALVFVLMRTARKGKWRSETLMREMHHRVKNNLQTLSTLLMLQSQELKDEKAVEAVKTSEGRVNAMALIHKKLYYAEQNREINLNEYITELVTSLIHSYGFAQRDLKLDLSIENIAFDVDKAIPLGLIINELVSNAFKYAFADHATPVLSVIVSQGDGILTVKIKDNGKSIDQVKLVNSDSYGIKMVNLLTRDLRGTLTISNAGGTAFALNVPIL